MNERSVQIVESLPQWPVLFEQEATRIHDAVDADHDAATSETLQLEHVGSTSVPGLAAKPIIDMLGGVENLADAEALIEPLEDLGYEYAPEFEESLPERRYFRKGADGVHTHHLHIVEVDSEFWNRHVAFRDYLREHPDVRDEYESLKRELAEQHGEDPATYGEKKDEFISSVEERALDGD